MKTSAIISILSFCTKHMSYLKVSLFVRLVGWRYIWGQIAWPRVEELYWSRCWLTGRSRVHLALSLLELIQSHNMCPFPWSTGMPMVILRYFLKKESFTINYHIIESVLIYLLSIRQRNMWRRHQTSVLLHYLIPICAIPLFRWCLDICSFRVAKQMHL